MDNPFLRNLDHDPELAATLTSRLDALRALDRSRVEMAEEEFARIRLRRPSFNRGSEVSETVAFIRRGSSITDFFEGQAIAERELIEIVTQNAKLAWEVVKTLERGHRVGERPS